MWARAKRRGELSGGAELPEREARERDGSHQHGRQAAGTGLVHRHDEIEIVAGEDSQLAETWSPFARR